MKKIVLACIVILACALCTATYAQSKKAQFGIRAGMNFSYPNNVKINNWSSFSEMSSGTGFFAGGYGEFKIPFISSFISVEALYQQMNMNIDMEGLDSKIKVHRIDVPVHYGIAIFKIIKPYIGPTFTFNVGNSIKSKQADTSLTGNWVALTFDVGLKVDIFRFSVDARYQFAGNGQDILVRNVDNGQNLTVKGQPGSLQVGLGFRF